MHANHNALRDVLVAILVLYSLHLSHHPILFGARKSTLVSDIQNSVMMPQKDDLNAKAIKSKGEVCNRVECRNHCRYENSSMPDHASHTSRLLAVRRAGHLIIVLVLGMAVKVLA
jgi:hypothetical protein